MAEDESGTLGLMIRRSSREKIADGSRVSRNALERTRQLEVRPRSASVSRRERRRTRETKREGRDTDDERGV